MAGAGLEPGNLGAALLEAGSPMRPRGPPFLTLAALASAMLSILTVVVVIVMHARLTPLNDARGAPDGPPAMRLLPPPQHSPDSPTASPDAPPSYDVAGGFWRAEVAYRFPEPEPRYARALGIIPWWLLPWRRRCFDLARDVDEPYGSQYQPRGSGGGGAAENGGAAGDAGVAEGDGGNGGAGGLPGAFPGGVPRALYRWDSGSISRTQFDAVPRWLRSR